MLWAIAGLGVGCEIKHQQDEQSEVPGKTMAMKQKELEVAGSPGRRKREYQIPDELGMSQREKYPEEVVTVFELIER